jgi:hypothetical protein
VPSPASASALAAWLPEVAAFAAWAATPCFMEHMHHNYPHVLAGKSDA